ncbi:DUF5995 family protein [Nocardia bovistercoris]|uniref:Uncharacterized protein n=1 Tax=Nocardia bovistercoris TaxID=2785916 RepID=A0A931IA58_9NOCA|nr:DUF5995 family protein [Nocardia bovistercoris]MBH0776492.1 hypothetical protein [Nocardia bovistercoris]
MTNSRTASRTTARRIGVAGLLVVLSAALTAVVPTPAGAVAAQACGSPLSEAEMRQITELSDTSVLTGSTMQRLEQAVDRHAGLTEILVRHRDRRGLLPLGLDAVEQAAVMPMQRDPAAFRDPEWAHRISLLLLARFLDAVHAEFTGAPVPPQWAHYFALAQRCELSAARVAMAGYNAHLSVDLSYALADSRATPDNAPDNFRIVDAIAGHGGLIVSRTKEVYGGDLGPLWRFYFVGEGLDAVLGEGVGSVALLRFADSGANVFIFANGLALQDPALAPAAAQEIDLTWRAVDAALEVLTRLGGL